MNYSLSLSAQDIAGCNANCIYFTDDYIDGQREGIQGGHDMGVYNMEGGRVEPLPGFASDAKLAWPPTIWVFPNPVRKYNIIFFFQ
ncbi:f-box protein skip23 [Quercus suber]|uniref:F-box protein skip23 n=1 Tax=Quercus suber TaxID=58331 RepID=A0AAW0KKK5_QUESU